MCYNVNYLTKKRLEYARRLKGIIDERILDAEIENIYRKTGPVYYVNGFNHPDIPVIANSNPDHLEPMAWGLIPFWVKDPAQAVSLSKRTLNARGEEMFNKPSFRNAALNKRCLILLDGFFEYHWYNGKSYPFYIRMANNDPMLIAGLWETWKYEKESLIRHTFSIVTTNANPLMAHIHNKPKASEGPRMPVIIPEGLEMDWLGTISDPPGLKKIKEMIQPYDESDLIAYTVPKLQGKYGVGNVKEALTEYKYEDLLN